MSQVMGLDFLSVLLFIKLVCRELVSQVDWKTDHRKRNIRYSFQAHTSLNYFDKKWVTLQYTLLVSLITDCITTTFMKSGFNSHVQTLGM
jgi:hypothetical protein